MGSQYDHGRSTADGTVNKRKKRYAQMIMTAKTTLKKPTEQSLVITFDQSDLKNVSYPYDDALVVTLNVDGKRSNG